MDKLSDWIIKIGNWEYDKDKPKKRCNDIDHIANMLINDFNVDVEHIEPYTELIVFAYVNENIEDVNDKIDLDSIKSYIKISGGIEKIIKSYKTK